MTGRLSALGQNAKNSHRKGATNAVSFQVGASPTHIVIMVACDLSLSQIKSEHIGGVDYLI